jgi:predicted short-subunit dehydrogenase-like oxidoreductase (DUF2520 family)
MRVVMLGSGNTATVLCELIAKAGHPIVQIVSRNEEHARSLAVSYSAATAILSVPEFYDADIYIVALNDVALDRIENIPGLRNKLVVHTAGSVSISVLNGISSSYGVLYPLQTLSKFSDHLPEIPFLIDGNDKETMHTILGFAKSISSKVIEANDAQRLNYHIAAVFVSNFVNHIYALAELFCNKERLDFKTLIPLIEETTQRAKEVSPFLTQTGPAIRDDVFTLSKHLQALSSNVDLKYIYLKLSESIIKFHGKR